MQTVDYNKLVQDLKPNTQITDDANALANTLIIDLNIQAGQGLAVFLGMPFTLDNHKALRRWVQKQLTNETGYVFAEMQGQQKRSCMTYCPIIPFITAY